MSNATHGFGTSWAWNEPFCLRLSTCSTAFVSIPWGFTYYLACSFRGLLIVVYIASFHSDECSSFWCHLAHVMFSIASHLSHSLCSAIDYSSTTSLSYTHILPSCLYVPARVPFQFIESIVTSAHINVEHSCTLTWNSQGMHPLYISVDAPSKRHHNCLYLLCIEASALLTMTHIPSINHLQF